MQGARTPETFHQPSIPHEQVRHLGTQCVGALSERHAGTKTGSSCHQTQIKLAISGGCSSSFHSTQRIHSGNWPKRPPPCQQRPQTTTPTTGRVLCDACTVERYLCQETYPCSLLPRNMSSRQTNRYKDQTARHQRLLRLAGSQ